MRANDTGCTLQLAYGTLMSHTPSTRQVCDIHQISPHLFFFLNLCSELPSPPTPPTLPSRCLSSWLFYGWHICKIHGLLIFLNCSLTSFLTFSSCMNIEAPLSAWSDWTPLPLSVSNLDLACPSHGLCVVMLYMSSSYSKSTWLIYYVSPLKRGENRCQTKSLKDWEYSGASLSNSWGRRILLSEAL